MELIIYGIYLFLAVFSAGNMTTLQIQHYGIYPFVGKDNFQNYIRANNQSALVPSILPAMLLVVINLILIFYRPVFFPMTATLLSLAFNGIALVSTFVWQRKLQGQMAMEGYDENKIRLLISTNWIRTIAFLTQAAMAVTITIKSIG